MGSTEAITTAQLDTLAAFDGEISRPHQYDDAGQPVGWEILRWPERGTSWDEVATAAGYEELGRWVTTLALAYTGEPHTARVLVDKLAQLEPPIEGADLHAYEKGSDRVPGMRYHTPLERAIEGGRI
jgi:hypothetical protein